MTEAEIHDLEKKAARIGHIVVPERRAPHWWDKWVNPTTVLALIGGIIWGIQLNSLVLQHTSQISALQTQQNQTIQVDHEQNKQLTRITTILSGLVERIEKDEQRFDKHVDEGEVWKRNIEVNEKRLDAVEERVKDHGPHALGFNPNGVRK